MDFPYGSEEESPFSMPFFPMSFVFRIKSTTYIDDVSVRRTWLALTHVRNLDSRCTCEFNDCVMWPIGNNCCATYRSEQLLQVTSFY